MVESGRGLEDFQDSISLWGQKYWNSVPRRFAGVRRTPPACSERAGGLVYRAHSAGIAVGFGSSTSLERKLSV